jgi:hypothetical protein
MEVNVQSQAPVALPRGKVSDTCYMLPRAGLTFYRRYMLNTTLTRFYHEDGGSVYHRNTGNIINTHTVETMKGIINIRLATDWTAQGLEFRFRWGQDFHLSIPRPAVGPTQPPAY